MAVDTQEKRQSALSLLVPSYTPGVEPSTIDQAERQAAAWVYAGIAAAAPGGGAGTGAIWKPLFRPRRR